MLYYRRYFAKRNLFISENIQRFLSSFYIKQEVSIVISTLIIKCKSMLIAKVKGLFTYYVTTEGEGRGSRNDNGACYCNMGP